MLFWEKFLNFKFIQIFNSWSLSYGNDETRTQDLLVHKQKPNRFCHKTNRTVKFVDKDVLEARSDETSESTFTEEAKAENAWRIIAWVLTYKFSPSFALLRQMSSNFRPITVSVIFLVFSWLIFLINFERKMSTFTSNEHVVLDLQKKSTKEPFQIVQPPKIQNYSDETTYSVSAKNELFYKSVKSWKKLNI